MKNESLENRNWDDLVFENRNQEYGAYKARKSYSSNLLSGTFLSFSFSALVLLVPMLTGWMGDDRGEETIICTLSMDSTIFSQPPVIKASPPKPPSPPPVHRVETNLTPVVTTQPTDDVIPTNEERDASLNNNTEGIEGGVPTPLTNLGIIEGPAIVEPPKIFDIVGIMPAYEGGLEAMYKFIQKKIKYPNSARRIGTEGTVYVSFVIDASGQVVDVKVSRGISSDCDKEAARVIALLPNWKAGRQHDRNVSVRMTVPIKFQMDN